jgi:hypothetical protein
VTLIAAMKCQDYLFHNLQQDTFASFFSPTLVLKTYLKSVLLLLSHLFLDFSSTRFPRGFCYYGTVCVGAIIYGHDCQGLESRQQEKIFSSLEQPRPAVGPTYSPNHWFLWWLPVGGRLVFLLSPCTLLPVHRWLHACACRRASTHDIWYGMCI